MLSDDCEDPLAVKHFSDEGQLEFRALLFAPRRALCDMFECKKKRSNVKLYIQQVLFSDDCDELLPAWLSFAYGVIDFLGITPDISRDTLKQNIILRMIGTALLSKCQDMLAEAAQNDVDYMKFYELFSKNVMTSILLPRHQAHGMPPSMS